MREKLPYKEGSYFLVPLRSTGFARGVVARMDGRGRVFGFFFGPRLETATVSSASDLIAHEAVLVGQFGDLGLIKGQWPILGTLPNWSRDEWQMPEFISNADTPEMAVLTKFDDDTMEVESMRTVRRDEIDPSALRDSSMGYGFVEIRLTGLLDPSTDTSA